MTSTEVQRFAPIDFDVFHQELPAKLAERGRILSDFDRRTLRAIAFRIDDRRSYSYQPDGESLRVVPGDANADTVVELSAEDWSDFCWELKTCYALFYADRMKFRSGGFGQLSRWEPVLRVAFDGQTLYDLDDPAVVSDTELDLSQSFTLDDLMHDDPQLLDFLHNAGFVHLRGVVGKEELARLEADIVDGVAGAQPDDKRSWWTTVEGRQVCNRVNYLNNQSDLIASLGSDQRFMRIGALAGANLRDACDRLDGNSVVIKVPGADGGLADLPWHRDCGMGGHPVKCPMLNIGIQIDAANEGAGRLEMIAGSHRGTSRLPGPKEAQHLPVVGIDTEPGDVTVHFGHTLHAAPPPKDRETAGRRALYLTFVPPLTFEMIGPGHGYNDVLFTRDSGRIRHVDEF